MNDLEVGSVFLARVALCVVAIRAKLMLVYPTGLCEEVEDAGERGERRKEHSGEPAGRERPEGRAICTAARRHHRLCRHHVLPRGNTHERVVARYCSIKRLHTHTHTVANLNVCGCACLVY